MNRFHPHKKSFNFETHIVFYLFYFKEILDQQTPLIERFVSSVREYFGLESKNVCLEVGSCIFFKKSFFLTFHVDLYSPICVMQKPSKQPPSSSRTPYLSVPKNKVAKEPQKGIIKCLKRWECFIKKYDITVW